MKYILTAISILVFTFFLVLSSIYIFATIPFSKNTRRDLIFKYWKYFSLMILNLICIAKVEKRDLRTSISSQTLFISNHRSLMDIPLFASNYQVIPLMKAEILRIPIIGLAGRMTGAITVSRKDNNSRIKAFRLCLKTLASGQSMIFFPEGTRSNTAGPKTLEEINTPLIQYAYKMKIAVTPLSMFGTENIISKYGTINYFHKIKIITHQEISPKDFTTDQEFIKACWDQVCLGYKELEST